MITGGTNPGFGLIWPSFLLAIASIIVSPSTHITPITAPLAHRFELLFLPPFPFAFLTSCFLPLASYHFLFPSSLFHPPPESKVRPSLNQGAPHHTKPSRITQVRSCLRVMASLLVAIAASHWGFTFIKTTTATIIKPSLALSLPLLFNQPSQRS